MLQNYRPSSFNPNFTNVMNLPLELFSSPKGMDQKTNVLTGEFFSNLQDMCPLVKSNSTLITDFKKDALLQDKQLIQEKPLTSFEAWLKNFKEKLRAERAEPKELPVCPKLEFNVSPIKHSAFNATLPSSPYKHISITDCSAVDSKWLQEIDECLANPESFKIIEAGISASYLILDKYNNPIAVYKPNDQAGGSALNPKGGALFGADSNEASVREFGARLIGGDFINVPELHLVKIVMNGKLQEGSLQKFVPNEGTGKNLLKPAQDALLKAAGVSKPLEKIQEWKAEETAKFMEFMQDEKKLWKYGVSTQPMISKLYNQVGNEIHKMGVLDIIIQNSDRLNPENYLYNKVKNSIKLIPIDHNLAFPERISPLFEQVIWMMSPASLLPFDKDVLNYIKNIDIEDTSAKLLAAGMNEKRIHSFKIMATVVKRCAEAGLPLREIGHLVSKSPTDYFGTTAIQDIEKEAWKAAQNREDFFPQFTFLLEKKIAKIQKQRDRQGVSKAAKPFYLINQPETYGNFKNWQKVMSCVQNSWAPHCVDDAKKVKKFYQNGTCLATNALFKD